MFYPAELIRQATIANGHLSEELICRLLPDPDDRKRSEESLRILLRNLPDAEGQSEILRELTDLASKYDATINQFEWWDIEVDRLHVLCATVHRNGRSIPVRFIWQCVRKGRPSSPDLGECKRPSVVPLSQAPHGFAVEFERAHRNSMLETFTQWLQE